MARVRAAAALLFAALTLVASGCGSSVSDRASAAAGVDVAKLVPPGALALVSVDTDFSSSQWRQLDELTRGLPGRERVLTMVRTTLADRGLQLDRDVKPALGSELDLAVLGVENGKPDAIALARPNDEAKLRTLAAKFDAGGEHYTVERVGGWSVVADSAEAFDAVRAAESGRSLADDGAFKAATDETSGDALVRVYASGAALNAVPRLGALLGSDTPRWFAARLASADGSIALRLSASAAGAPAAYAPTLFGDIPADASFAASFRLGEHGKLPAQLDAALKPLLGFKLGDALSALSGEGALYLSQNGLLPVIALEVRPKDPARAEQALRSLAARLQKRLGGVVPLVVQRVRDRVVLTDSPAAATSLGGGGPKLVDESRFKDAVEAAGGLDRTTGLLYADVPRLLPLLQAGGSLLGKPLSQQTIDGLGRLDSIVVVGARRGGISRVEARLALR